jgi:predicted nucleotidyltransferase
MSIQSDIIGQHPHLDEILNKLYHALQSIYGERLVHLVLFGSQGRGDAEADSDIDVLIVLRDEQNTPQEIERVRDVIAALSLDYNTVISQVLVSEAQYRHEQSPLLINVRREGKIVA